MQANRSREGKKKPILWIIVVVAGLLAGALVFYSWHLQTGPPRVPTPVVARGKIPPPPPSPSVESPGGPSTSVESAPPTEAGGHGDAPDAGRQSDLESSPAASVDAGSQETASEIKPENAEPPQEVAVLETGQETVDAAEQTGDSLSSAGQASAPDSDDGRTATDPVDELQTAVRETPESPPSSDTPPPPSSDRTAADAAPDQTASAKDAPETTAPYAIQVGAYRTKSNADRQIAQLREKGFDAYLHEKNDKGRRAWYFVRFGRFEDFGSADKALTVFKEQQQMDAAVVNSD